MENEPVIKLELLDGSEIEARRQNTSLFKHMGHAAIYDHVFVILDEEKNSGAFIFAQNPSYAPLESFLLQNGYPMHLNILEPSQTDINAWERAVAAEAADDLDTGIPAEWLNND